MQTINFLHKIRELKNRSGELTTRVVVYNALDGSTHSKNFEGKANLDEIKYWLQTYKYFQYKHYTVYFVDEKQAKFY